MSMIIKKNQIVTVTLLVALCGAVFVNWYYSRPSSSATPTANLGEAEYVNATTASTTQKSKSNTVSEYFAGAELKRKNAHDKASNTLKEVITNKESSADAVKNATEELSKLAATIKQETDLENIIKAKIKTDCIVILNGEKAEVIIDNSMLNEKNISIIKTTILEQTETKAENIAIIGAK